MKITKSQLKEIIKEEIETVLNEIEGMSPEEYRQMDPRGALSAAHTEKDCDHARARVEYYTKYDIRRPWEAKEFQKIVPIAKKCEIL